MYRIGRAAGLASIPFLLASASLSAQTPLADSAMKLNHAGLWQEAGEFAVKGVRETTSQDDRCGLIFSSIYSLIRQGQLDAGRAEIRVYDMQCTPLPSASRYATGLEMLRIEGAMPPIPVTGSDLSSADRFWTIVDTLSRDIEPSSHLWRLLLATPGYRIVLRSNDGLQRQIDLAFRPSRRAERDSSIHASVSDSVVIVHLLEAASHRSELVGMSATLAKSLADSIQVALRAASRFLPPDALKRTSPPFVAFALFGNDAVVEGSAIVLDLFSARGNGVTHTLSDDFYRVYTGALAPEATPTDATDTRLYHAIHSLRDDGIANLIDTPKALGAPGVAAPPPLALRSLDSLLAEADDQPTQRDAAGAQAEAVLSREANPVGPYIAREILQTFGRDSIVAAAYSPFRFIRMFAAAEQKRGNPAPFSGKAVAMLDFMEKRWMR